MRIVHCTRLLLFVMVMLALPVSFAQVSISVNFAPPDLPVRTFQNTNEAHSRRSSV